ncbi:hypothetical protein SAMN04487941_0999 [Pontibacter akesuensis]|uniref:Uncharacterized protein n=1 Tax=Pontibacter akesuensis TaxID=388950 RepID=A0A1I7GGU0_9BACT|nr:hypothetical protein SAMN04487941_0999 [Pontibacter akesuensis]
MRLAYSTPLCKALPFMCCRNLCIANYTFVGHSMGGKNALQVAADAPPEW